MTLQHRLIFYIMISNNDIHVLYLQNTFTVMSLDFTKMLYIDPRLINVNTYPTGGRVGNVYARHVTAGQDLQTVNQVLGSTYDGVIIITGICVAGNAQVHPNAHPNY